MPPSSFEKTITVLGCGYVGLTTAALLANCGFKVYAVEPDLKRLKIIKQGRSFFYEAGLDELINNALVQGTLIATDSYDESVPHSSLVFSCVGTPDNPDGSSNLTYVFDAAAKALGFMKPGVVFVQKSTVPVGTGAKIEKTFSEAGRPMAYVSNPEFLREGTAIADTLWSDRIVTGSADKKAADKVIGLYKQIEASNEILVKLSGIKSPSTKTKPLYISTSRNSAELIKVTANAFLALKVTFANSIAKLADKADADIVEVMDAVGADKRIGRAFLNAGRGYGGGCFPKDVSGLIRSASDYGVGMEIMETASEVNNSMPHYIVNKAEQAMSGFNGKTVAVLGLAFKAGTSDTRRSPAITIADTLVQKGARVRAYDPEAMEEAKHYDLDKKVDLCDNLESAVQDIDCIFVATDWPEFINMDLSAVAKLSKAKLLVDCMNCLDKSRLPKTVKYIGVGKA